VLIKSSLTGTDRTAASAAGFPGHLTNKVSAQIQVFLTLMCYQIYYITFSPLSLSISAKSEISAFGRPVSHVLATVISNAS